MTAAIERELLEDAVELVDVADEIPVDVHLRVTRFHLQADLALVDIRVGGAVAGVVAHAAAVSVARGPGGRVPRVVPRVVEHRPAETEPVTVADAESRIPQAPIRTVAIAVVIRVVQERIVGAATESAAPIRRRSDTLVCGARRRMITARAAPRGDRIVSAACRRIVGSARAAAGRRAVAAALGRAAGGVSAAARHGVIAAAAAAATAAAV